jgi:hypothetical protein
MGNNANVLGPDPANPDPATQPANAPFVRAIKDFVVKSLKLGGPIAASGAPGSGELGGPVADSGAPGSVKTNP